MLDVHVVILLTILSISGLHWAIDSLLVVSGTPKYLTGSDPSENSNKLSYGRHSVEYVEGLWHIISIYQEECDKNKL